MSVMPDSAPTVPCLPEVGKMLAAVVWMLRCRTRRQVFAPSARVYLLRGDGQPVTDPSSDLLAPTGTVLDHALRVDLAVAGIDAVLASFTSLWTSRRRRPHHFAPLATLVLVRPGPLEVLEEDRAWGRAWLIACGIVGVEPGPVYAASRAGWIDVGVGEPVTVPRLRAPRDPRRRTDR
jgi:hypothetical protein